MRRCCSARLKGSTYRLPAGIQYVPFGVRHLSNPAGSVSTRLLFFRISWLYLICAFRFASERTACFNGQEGLRPATNSANNRTGGYSNTPVSNKRRPRKSFQKRTRGILPPVHGERLNNRHIECFQTKHDGRPST